MFGLDIALLVGGAIITESVFNLQGLGYLAINDALQQDLPVVLGVVLRRLGRRRDREPGRRRSLRVHRPAGPLRVRGLTSRATSRRRRAERQAAARRPRPDGPLPDGRRRRPGGLATFASRSSRGETLGIVGESGSGKSVSNLAIMGLLNRQRTDDHRARSTSSAATCSGCPPERAAEDPRQGHRDGLPGSVRVPAPDVPRRRADRRSRDARTPMSARRSPGRARSSCSATSASRTRSRAHATTRTSSPAACASAR